MPLDAGPELDGLGCRPQIVAIIDPVVGSVCRADGLDLEQLLELADAGRPLAEANGAEPAPAMPEVLDVVAAEVLVEVTPTNLETGEPGLSHLRQALAAGLHTVTTNKGPVASIEPRDGGWRARVAPEEMDKDDPLASVVGAGNLLLFDTEALGPVVITGPGAGRRCTGHSVVVDLLAIHRARSAGR